ncbi:fumarylacetoacetate hydrolase family protein [Rhodococcus opacus]
MRLYRTCDGLARGEGDDLVFLDPGGRDMATILGEGIETLRNAPERGRVPFDAATLLCPIDTPGKVVLAGANYRDHVAEAGMPMPSAPVFITTAGGAVVGPGTQIVLPEEAPNQVDYEGELALVVGVAGHHIPAVHAWRHIAALTIVNDVSARDVQLAGMVDGVITDIDGVRRGKVFPTFKPLGPGLVTVDEFDLPLDLAIRTFVNGQLRQSARTSEMIFSIPQIIEHVSSSVYLDVGDVILTGTPAGVGLATGVYMQPGDLVEIEIDGIGRLSSPVLASASVADSATQNEEKQ